MKWSWPGLPCKFSAGKFLQGHIVMIVMLANRTRLGSFSVEVAFGC